MAINIGSAVAYLELDTSKFSKGFKSAINDLKVFGDKSSSAEQRVKGLSSAFKTTGSTLTKNVTVPLAGIGTMASKVAIDFEAKMSEVQAISGATGKEFEELEKKAIEMGAKTKFSAGESAEAFKYMAMAGWNTEEMLNSISGVMDLAAASGEDLALTSDIVTDAMTAFGLSADGTSKVLKDGLIVEVSNATRFVDVLAKASSRSNTNVAMMGETFKYVAPVAGALGYSVEDVSVAVGLMANSGIKASQAGTALRTLMTNMAKPTEQMSVAMDALGLSLDDGEGNMLSFKEVMLQMREGFGQLIISEKEFDKSLNRINASLEDGSMSEKQYEKALGRLIDRAYGAEGALKAQYASMLAGKEGMSGFLAIVNATDEEFESLTNDIYNANGATQEMADIMLDNTAGAIEQLTGALESAGIIIGQQLTPYIRQLAEWITGLVEKFNSLSEEQQGQITKWGLILASIGPILLIVSKLINVFISFKNTFTLVKTGLDLLSSAGGFTALLNPISLVVGAILGLVAVVINLWNTNEEFRNKVIEIWNNLQTSIGDFVSGIKQILDDLGLNFEEIKEAILFTWNALCDSLSPLITGAMDIAVKVIDGALDTILGIFKVFAKLFKGDWRGALDAVEDIIDGWIETIIGVFSSMFETIGGFFKKILGGIQDVVDKGNKAKGITRGGMYADGSHADGLSYVPYDGYIAELHEGERVLTKQQNKDYNKGTGTGGDTYNFYNTQPNPYEYARQMKKAKRELLQGV